MRKRESEWMDVSKSTSPDETEIPASATKLKLVFDEPLKRTIQDSAVVGQFAYASGLDAPNGYTYQISHVLEISTSSLSIQRAARRAEMHEYPLLSDHFPIDHTLYVIIRNSPGYQEFKLRGKEQCEDERVISMRREWTGGWKVYGNSVDVQDYLFRCTPDWSKRKDGEEECRWMTRNGTLPLALGVRI